MNKNSLFYSNKYLSSEKLFKKATLISVINSCLMEKINCNYLIEKLKKLDKK